MRKPGIPREEICEQWNFHIYIMPSVYDAGKADLDTRQFFVEWDCDQFNGDTWQEYPADIMARLPEKEVLACLSKLLYLVAGNSTILEDRTLKECKALAKAQAGYQIPIPFEVGPDD